MKANFVYEAFSEESDPIKDMDIGGLNPKQALDKLFEDLLNNWKQYLMQFYGKKITGELHPNDPDTPSSKMTTGIIKDIRINKLFQKRDIRFIDNKGVNYFFLDSDGDKKFMISK